MGNVPTGKAAAALGVNPGTLWRWQKAGIVTPELTTPGGQARWDIDNLREQLRKEEPVPEATNPEQPPVVAAIVTSERGVLVGARNDGKPPWTFIAGEIEPGESQALAAVREVKEETGLAVTAAEHEIGRRVHPKTHRTMIYLACTPATDDTGIVVGDPEELAEVRWAGLDEVHELMDGKIYQPVADHLADVLK